MTAPATQTAPSFDTDYDLEHFLAGPVPPDREFLYRRLSDATVALVAEAPPGRVLDVGSGGSKELARLAPLGWRAVALDPSTRMLGFAGLARDGAAERNMRLVRGIGERLPFADATFERVMCQASLDHFAQPRDFMREVARVLRPDGRAVISLQNFDGLTCRVGRALHPLAKASRLHHCGHATCWEIPPDHTFRGNWDVVCRLGEPWLALERAHGVSLLCMMYGWGHALRRVPAPLRERLLRGLDRAVRGRPSAADVIVSVWRPRGGAPIVDPTA